MSKTLVIAEKPSVASDLAKALGGFKKDGDFFENDQFVISSAVGHLLELVPPAGFEPAKGKWKIENLPSLPEHFELVPIEKNVGRLNTLKRLLKRKDILEVINACDAGREGELIFRNLVKASGVKKPYKRLWLQSMTPDSIRAAFTRLRSDGEMQPLADAATSRSEADWLVGINSTRALTAFNSQSGGFNKTTSGRVQTPTLAILVDREQKIRAFKPRTYFEVLSDFGVAAGSYRGRWFDPTFKKGAEEEARAERIWHRAQAEAIKAKCDGKPGVIEEEKKPTSQAPPLLYDLTTLQREANSRFGFPAKMTLQIAQALYEKHKALTYPRTDSRYLPEDHLPTARHVMEEFVDPTLAVHAQKALNQGWVRPNKRIFNNAKVSDHFAIVPTGTVPKNLSETEQKLFDMVARRFIAVFFPAAQFEITTRITTVENEKFKTDGKIIVDPGWLAVYGKQAEGEGETDKAIVAVRPGEPARTEAIEVKQSETKPPARYNEATLLSAMEGAGKFIDDEEMREAMSERGLGTPATRAQIIEGLINEGYIIRQQRELIVTAKGISLITLLRDLHAETLTKPELTGEWESKLKRMERGELSRAEFMQQIRLLTTEVVEKVRLGMGKEVRGEFHPLEVSCPKCGSGPFKESFRLYECPNQECKLTLWKSMAGRELEREEVIKLLTDRKVGPLEGFRSKLGRSFAASVMIGEDWKQKFDFEKNEGGENGEPIVPINPEPLGACRVCNTGQVYETASAFICENVPQKKCTFRMGKLILQREIPRAQAAKLLATGKTDLLQKFVSTKTKRSFAAYLNLGEGGKVGFEFEPRAPKKPAKKAVAAKEA
ncbi:MAG: topoisomerase [Chthoniobacteraceae bacterium]|nr:topoisomerase [Chthoniobacteraceae bacterium]